MSRCTHCESPDLQRIMSSVAYLRSEADKLAQLDPKYTKMVDRALAKAPNDTNPSHYVDKWCLLARRKNKGILTSRNNSYLIMQRAI